MNVKRDTKRILIIANEGRARSSFVRALPNLARFRTNESRGFFDSRLSFGVGVSDFYRTIASPSVKPPHCISYSVFSRCRGGILSRMLDGRASVFAQPALSRPSRFFLSFKSYRVHSSSTTCFSEQQYDDRQCVVITAAQSSAGKGRPRVRRSPPTCPSTYRDRARRHRFIFAPPGASPRSRRC